ncbi:MAG: disulfide bond formation protein B [Candidatus Vogelbacteria bacterium]|nr:disulfide bond formation protein B [Candidatus Vogelbacteria bacterium]
MQKKYYLYASWFVALAAMLGSLYFSEILKLPPCVLCWYQRILMYPLVLIIPVAILNRDEKGHSYVLPLSILGGCVAFYHYLLYIKIIPDTLAPCSTGVSCTTRLVEWFGFINIPLLSFIAFVVITLLMIIYSKTKENE